MGLDGAEMLKCFGWVGLGLVESTSYLDIRRVAHRLLRLIRCGLTGYVVGRVVRDDDGIEIEENTFNIGESNVTCIHDIK
jgi:hypothetical protein